ncbi:hypothetical protein [Amycolatopsis sp.]|uniref:hypothetical protein n=1 Tax=Amycolatopsis sp. TaxID=37632 RepID=UPI002D198F50|nr:hypothetical protein [Amycolatopsis sp.]HVV12465.1 hypothetical protein [Amycolatopsis sp.]
MPRPTDKDYLQQYERTNLLLIRLRDTLEELDECLEDADNIVRADMTGLHEFAEHDERDFLQHLAIAGTHLRGSERVLSGYRVDLGKAMAHEGVEIPENGLTEYRDEP